MSFAPVLDDLPLKRSPHLRRFEELLAPKTDSQFEAMARAARSLTLQNFGRTMRLFAPLYLSNECINNCRYCGFSRDNPILRVTLDIDEVVAEGQHLARQGFRQILLVTGEHPKFVNRDYLADCVRALTPAFSSISIEVGPMEIDDYVPIVEAGADGLVVYQETYNRGVYAEMHTAGPKRDFDFRLDCAERGYAAGFRPLGIEPCAAASSRRNTRRAKINSPRANSRSATNVPRPKLPQSFAVADLNRSGKIGTRPSAAHEDFSCSGSLQPSRAGALDDENLAQWRIS